MRSIRIFKLPLGHQTTTQASTMYHNTSKNVTLFKIKPMTTYHWVNENLERQQKFRKKLKLYMTIEIYGLYKMCCSFGIEDSTLAHILISFGSFVLLHFKYIQLFKTLKTRQGLPPLSLWAPKELVIPD